MTIHRRISISCDVDPSPDVTIDNGQIVDECDDRLDLSARTQVEARERAKARGWHHINPSRYICGACWKAGRR